MVSLPLTFDEFTLWLAMSSVILLVTSELLSSHYGGKQILVNRKRLRNIALAASVLVLITMAIRVANLILD